MPYYKTRLFLVKDGVDFVGYKIYLDKIKVRKSNFVRLKKRLKKIELNSHLDDYESFVKTQYISWNGYSKHADAMNLTRKIFNKYGFLMHKIYTIACEDKF